MRAKLTTIAAALAVLSMASAALAQSFGQGGARQGGFGLGMGQRGGLGFGMGYNPLQLLGRVDVEKDVAVTEDQLTKLKELNTKMQDARRKAMDDMRGNPNAGDRETMMKELQKLQEKWNKEQQAELEKILSADQLKRTKEIYVQLMGNRIIMDPAFQKELAITEKQKEDIRTLQTKQQEANMALFEKVRNQEISREDMQTSMQKNAKILDDELGKLLTSEQTEKIKTMKGTKTFTPDKEVKYNYGGFMMGGQTRPRWGQSRQPWRRYRRLSRSRWLRHKACRGYPSAGPVAFATIEKESDASSGPCRRSNRRTFPPEIAPRRRF